MTTTSKEYAAALFELSVGANQTKETMDGLETVVSALLQTPAYRDLLASPAISRVVRIQALDAAFRGKIPDVLLWTLRMMISRGHVKDVDKMARDYMALVRGYRGESIAKVTSAVEMKEADAAILRQKLEQRFHRTVIMQFEVDPRLIGGLRVELDGKVIDGSLRNKLDQIKDVMNA